MSTSHSFPANEYEALALLYLQNKDISLLTPEELIKEYRSIIHALMLADEP
ncbi:MAG: hypothetical protein IJP31_06530 [Lachnospiraceae bacterium]|nr:hypothetical protein [Lachnospiraceae bacterium]